MAIWPFTRAKPSGYTDAVDTPTAAELNKIDTQLAQAADGVVWTDAVIAKNWTHESGAVANRGAAWVWTGTRWLSIGLSSTTPNCSYSIGGKNWTSIGSMGTGAGYSAVNCAASNGNGIVVVGGTPSGASVQKLRRSADHGATWSIPNSVDSTIAGVVALVWFPAANLFIAALSNGNIETSPDGTTWTARTSPNVASGFAVSPTAVVCGRNRSTDGITWTSLSAQFTTDYYAFGYSSALSKFLALGFNSVPLIKASSDDGLTWSAAGLTAPAEAPVGSAENLASYGRTIIMGGSSIYYTLDGGVSWKTAKNLSAAVQKQPALGNGQFLFADSGTAHFGSFIAGS